MQVVAPSVLFDVSPCIPATDRGAHVTHLSQVVHHLKHRKHDSSCNRETERTKHTQKPNESLYKYTLTQKLFTINN